MFPPGISLVTNSTRRPDCILASVTGLSTRRGTGSRASYWGGDSSRALKPRFTSLRNIRLVYGEGFLPGTSKPASADKYA